jgi:hypothetical protein
MTKAIQIAHVLFDACSGDRRFVDLWQGIRGVAVARLFVPRTFDGLSAANQDVLETEGRIVHSEWRIARSRRLSKGSNKKMPSQTFGDAS